MGLGGGSVVECLFSTLENLGLIPNTEKNKKWKGEEFGWPFLCWRGSVAGMICEGQCNRTAPWGWCAGTVLWGRSVMGLSC